jgi:glycosyltransferase involved in cell wall biosynthesis
VGIPVARLTGLPSLSTCHGYIPTTWKVRLYNALDRIALKFGTQVLAVSEAIKQDLVDSGLSPDRVQVVVNAVGSATDRAHANREAGRKSHGIDSTDFVLGYVGRLSAEKGLKYLLTACAELVASGVPLKALIIGGGPQRNELGQLSRQLGLDGRVVFAGFQEDAVQWLPCMDVFVLPSLTEGTPMALLEAMAHGIPAVASAVGGVPQVIKHGETGILVSPGSAEEISRATRAMFGDPAARQKLAENALVLVKTRYGIDQWIGRIEMEYQSLARQSA